MADIENKEISDEKENKTTTKKAKKTKNSNTENNRFADVIGKMEEETKKVEKKKSEKKKNTEEKQKIAEENNKKTNKDKTKEDVSLVVSKKEIKEMSEMQKELEAVKEEIKSQDINEKEIIKKANSIVFQNIIFAILSILYFVFICIGYTTIAPEIYATDLKVFSMVSIIATICVFEYAYKKDSGKYAINGIELLIISICTFLSLRIYYISDYRNNYSYNSKFIKITICFALLFAVYYTGKAIFLYVKEKRKIRKKEKYAK